MSVHTWVLLRGLTRESGHWGDFPARLLRALRVQQPEARLELLEAQHAPAA